MLNVVFIYLSIFVIVFFLALVFQTQPLVQCKYWDITVENSWIYDHQWSAAYLDTQNIVSTQFSSHSRWICVDIVCLCAVPSLCVFQDLRKRRSVWKHISLSNDTEALAVDAFKKQCYMKVNRAIKRFPKRQCGSRDVLAVPQRGSGAQKYILGALKTKLDEVEIGASRDLIHEAVHYTDILKNSHLTLCTHIFASYGYDDKCLSL